MPQIAIDPQLFTWPSDDPHLLGSKCPKCTTTTFPTQSGCPRCGNDELDTIELPTTGTLWTWTTQGFRPKGPPEGYYNGADTEETFQGYGLGYVELPGACKVETRLLGPVDSFEIGQTMHLRIVPWRTDENGNEVMTYAFARGTPPSPDARGPGASPDERSEA